MYNKTFKKIPTPIKGKRTKIRVRIFFVFCFCTFLREKRWYMANPIQFGDTVGLSHPGTSGRISPKKSNEFVVFTFAGIISKSAWTYNAKTNIILLLIPISFLISIYSNLHFDVFIKVFLNLINIYKYFLSSVFNVLITFLIIFLIFSLFLILIFFLINSKI